MYLGTKRCLLCGFDIAGNNLHPGQLQLTHHEFSLLQQPTVPPSIVHFKEDILCSFSGSFFFLFWVTTRICLHVLMLKKHISFLIPSCAAALYFPLCLKHSLRHFKALPLNTKPALTGHTPQPTLLTTTWQLC